MNSLAEVQYTMQFELEAQRRELQTKREQDRWKWWMAAASTSQGAKKESRIRRVAVWTGDFVAGLRCQLESRLSSEQVAAAC